MIASVSFIGIGVMTSVMPLISPEKGMQLGFIAQGMLLVVSGVYYPVSVLPEWMQALSKISPATYALEGIRAAILDGDGLNTMWGVIWPLLDHRRRVGAARPVGLPPWRGVRKASRKAEAKRMTNYFGGEVAARYDASAGHEFEPAVIASTVDMLADLAGDGAALELGIGTGRIALPLAARGVPVHGIDLSPEMVEQLRAKAGGSEIPVAIGDFATTRVDGRFSLVYVVFNTIMNLTTQDAQIACFENAAAHLDPGGSFVVEVGVPSGRALAVFDLSDTHVGVDEY